MSIETPTGDMDAARKAVAGRFPAPEFRFPSGWTLSSSWRRAQVARAEVMPSDHPAEWVVMMASEDTDELGDPHRVTFAIVEGTLRAQCNCDGYRYRDFCAHVGRLWWRWVRGRLDVVDLDTERVHPHPPCWLRVEDGGSR
jgi:hypothetical protein